jgi:tetratricopeptide (TPR) repeat protein
MNDSIYLAYGWRGLANFQLDRFTEALRDFNIYLNRDSSAVEIRYDRAMILNKSGYYDGALKDINKVLFYSENYPNALNLKADCLFHLEDFADVIDLLKRKPESDFTDNDNKMIGFSYMQTGKYIDALEYLTKYISENKSDLQVLVWRGTCYFSISDYNSAINDFDSCIGLSPKDGVIYYLRGMSYLKMKNIPAACSDFRNAETNGYKVPLNYKDTCPK